MTGGLVITDVVIGGRPGMALRATGGSIVAVGPVAGVVPEAGDRVLAGSGGALIPGLHDHHVHLLASAAAHGSLPAGPPDVTSEAELVAALHARVRSGAWGSGWERAVGYHESVAGALDRDRLDAWVPDRPLRVQHRTGVLWVLNSTALDRLGAAEADHPGIERDGSGRPTGRLWRADAWLAGALAAVGAAAAAGVGAAGGDGDDDDTGRDARRAALAELSREAARRGVTGFTDADPRRTPADLAAWAELVAGGEVVQRLHLMGPAGLAAEPGAGLPPTVTVGPVKVLLDDTDLPPPPELAARVTEAHAEGRALAVHCVTRVQLVVALAAFEQAGARAGDRIEHGSVIPAEAIADLRRLGLTVVTQPNFVAERGDQYLADVDPADRPDLYRVRSLLDAGIAVAFGTDRPYGGADPWSAVVAAVHRRSAAGATVNPGEAVTPAVALRAFLGSGASPATPRRLAPGEPADLCLLARPLPELDGSVPGLDHPVPGLDHPVPGVDHPLPELYGSVPGLDRVEVVATVVNGVVVPS